MELLENYAINEDLLGEAHLGRTKCFQPQVVLWFDPPELFHRLWAGSCDIQSLQCCLSIFVNLFPVSLNFICYYRFIAFNHSPQPSAWFWNVLECFRYMNRDVGPLSHTISYPSISFWRANMKQIFAFSNFLVAFSFDGDQSRTPWGSKLSTELFPGHTWPIMGQTHF